MIRLILRNVIADSDGRGVKTDWRTYDFEDKTLESLLSDFCPWEIVGTRVEGEEQ